MLSDILKRNKEWKPLVNRLAELEGKAKADKTEEETKTSNINERHSEL